jgi:ArsR family transcriptional regulator
METIDLAKIFKALSNEQRLKLFKMLYEWCDENNSGAEFCYEGVEKCFTKACCSMNLSRSTISHHMKELQNAGLITFTRNGQCFVCKINREALQAVWDFLKT